MNSDQSGNSHEHSGGIMDTSKTDLLDLIALPVIVLSPDERDKLVYRYFNTAALEAMGAPLEDVQGRSARELYPGKLGDIAYQLEYEVYRSGVENTLEMTLPLKGRFENIRTHFKPVIDDQGNVIELIGTRESTNAEIAIREVQTSSEALNTDMEDFVNLAAHDLRSPVRKVKFLADLLREDFEDLGDGKLELIHMLEDVASKAMILTNDVLNHAQAASAVASIENFGLQAMVLDLISTLDPERRHRVHVDDIWICGDRIACQIILRNLIDNAFKHNMDGTIDLTVIATPHGSRTLEIKVADNGQGFSDTALEFLEGGGFRVDSGYGLLGVRRLVQSRGGKIEASQCPSGKGALVCVTLPGQVLGDSVAQAAG